MLTTLQIKIKDLLLLLFFAELIGDNAALLF